MLLDKWTDLPMQDANPWFDGFDSNGKYTVRFNNQTTTISDLSNPVLPDNPQGRAFFSTKRVSKSDFVKLYVHRVADVLKIGSAAEKILLYLVRNIGYNSDKVYFKLQDVMTELGYKSHAPIYAGLKELADLEVIARSKDNRFIYVNPAVIHKGDIFIIAEAVIADTAENIPDFLPQPSTDNILENPQ